MSSTSTICYQHTLGCLAIQLVQLWCNGYGTAGLVESNGAEDLDYVVAHELVLLSSIRYVALCQRTPSIIEEVSTCASACSRW